MEFGVEILDHSRNPTIFVEISSSPYFAHLNSGLLVKSQLVDDTVIYLIHKVQFHIHLREVFVRTIFFLLPVYSSSVDSKHATHHNRNMKFRISLLVILIQISRDEPATAPAGSAHIIQMYLDVVVPARVRLIESHQSRPSPFPRLLGISALASE